MKNFAPFSSANSGELRLAAGYFLVSGISTIVILSVALIGGLFVEPGLGAVVKEHPLGFFLGLAIQFLASAGWIWTAFLLSSAGGSEEFSQSRFSRSPLSRLSRFRSRHQRLCSASSG